MTRFVIEFGRYLFHILFIIYIVLSIITMEFSDFFLACFIYLSLCISLDIRDTLKEIAEKNNP